MKLIDLLVKELPKRGGWPETASTATQDSDGEICFSSGGKHEYCITSWKGGEWTGDSFMAEHAIDYEISIITREQYEATLSASKKPAWNGEGLPPVGEKVEFFINPKFGYRNAWIPDAGTEMEVVAHKTTTDGNNVAVCYWDERGAGRSCCFVPESLKPLRTESERKRDEAAEAIDFYMPEFIPDTPNEFYHAKKIYDAIAAGKIPGVKLED
ncbi:hypothetical protein ACES27_004600 [Salmonella enterica]|nr:hypothetical protein [Salmonella enterica]